MKLFLIPLSPLLLSCVATAFVPFHQKLALAPRRHVPPLTPATQPPQKFLLVHEWNCRQALRPLYASIVDEIKKLNQGDERDPITKEELQMLRGILAKIEEAQAEDLVKDILREISEKAFPKVLQGVSSRGVELSATAATATATATKPVNVSLANAIARPADTVNLTGVEVQGKAVFRTISEFLDFLEDVVDTDDKMQYATYPRHKEFPDVSLTEMMKLLDGTPPLEYFFSTKKFFRILMTLLKVKVGLAMTDKQVSKAKTVQEKYSAVFTKSVMGPLDLVPLPEYAFKHWKEDKEFSRQFLDGLNPLMIRVVKDVNQDLSNELINFFKDNSVVDLESLANEKRLLFVSYDDLTQLHVNPHQAFPKVYNPTRKQDQPRFFSAPIVVFQLSNDLEELQVLAIQLNRTSDAEIYTPATTDPNTWLFAKSIVKTADAQMHEWVSHLGKTHLTMEPHIIAIHNTLKRKRHKLFTFFKPMIRDTLFLGFAARRTLAKFGPESFGDRVTSVGVGQFMQLIKMYWQRYSFFESSGLDNELASRGFDKDFKMPCYHFREDGLKLWNAYGRFATDFLDELYKTDSDVANDPVLQEWAKETTDADKATIPGFPKSFKDKKTLAAVMQTLFWIASGLHAAVNYPQYDNYSYLPNHPLGFRQTMENFKESKDKSLEWMFSQAFPLLNVLKETVTVASALTLPSNFCIDNLSDNFSKIGAGPYQKFKKELKTIGDDINARNAANARKRVATYPYLHPSKVPASIDI